MFVLWSMSNFSKKKGKVTMPKNSHGRDIKSNTTHIPDITISSSFNMLGFQTLCIGLILPQFFLMSQANLVYINIHGEIVKNPRNYAIIFPSELRSQHMESFCIHLLEKEADSHVQISLIEKAKGTVLIDRIFPKESKFTCIPVLIPNPSDGNDEVARIEVSIKAGEKSFTSSTKVIVKKETPKLIIQTDKAVYQPGDIVKFRILSLTQDLQPGQDSVDSVHLQDPGKNRIAQWLNVKLNQGLAELSLPISSNPTLGEYSIRAQNTAYYFTVKEHAELSKYEVNLKLPKAVFIDMKHFSVNLCARYTYAKPVHGDYKIDICRKTKKEGSKEPMAFCQKYTGEMDASGCSTVQVNTQAFNLTQKGMQMNLEGSATITEKGTGKELKTRSRTDISNVLASVWFDKYITTYKPGMPVTVMLSVKNGIGEPVAGQRVKLCAYNKDFTRQYTGVSDENGRVTFTFLDTASWEGVLRLEAMTEGSDTVGSIGRAYSLDALELTYYYSRSKTFLKIHTFDKVLPCDGEQNVKVEYIIKRTELEDINELDLQFLITSKGSIEQSGVLQIPISPGDEDVHGEAFIKLSLTPGTPPLLHVFAYILLPNVQLVGDSGKFYVQRCFKNKVSVKFAQDNVLPGSDVSLKVQAEPGSLCGLRVVDKSVVNMDPGKELTENKIFSLFSYRGTEDYDHRIQEQDICRFRKHQTMSDARSLLQEMKLKMIAGPPDCPDTIFPYTYTISASAGSAMERLPGDSLLFGKIEKPRTDFPPTWIWQLVPVGDSGTAEFHHNAPDTITDWNAGALCMGPSGVGLSAPTSLNVFRPFFTHLTFPNSVVRGETFIIASTVHNFLNQNLKVESRLIPYEGLDQEPCDDCNYNSCLGTDEAKTFSWKVKASKLGKIDIMVTTNAVNSVEMCQNEIPIVPKQGATDTVIKELLVQPEGAPQEKSYSSMICNKDAGDSKTEDVTLTIPENTVQDSGRAHITVLGDLMGIALHNLDQLLAMPSGNGEQNMVHFASNVFMLQYLDKTHQLTDDTKSKATKFLKTGYQTQLLYKSFDGSYSQFGRLDPVGNTWLTAFVVKSFSSARPYIFIDENHLNAAVNWLRNHRKEDGSFWRLGKLYNNAMKGGVDDDISLTAYVTITLLESNIPETDPMVRDALTYLKHDSENVTDVYTQALLAYTFTLSQDMELRATLLDKIEKKAVREEGQLHWKHETTLSSNVPIWHRASSSDVEITSYVLLATLYGPKPDMDKAKEIVNWLGKQTNPKGGFSSIQDTVVALQGLAKYAKTIYDSTGDNTVTVTIASKTGYLKEFHVDNKNRFLLQKATLPDIPGDYTVTTKGKGCVIVQSVLRYNIPPTSNDNSFEVSAKNEKHEEKNIQLEITAKYTGPQEKSNLAIMEVNMLSGYIPVKDSVKELEKNPAILKCQIENDKVILYIYELSHKPEVFTIPIAQEIKVSNLKPAIVSLYDNYEPAKLAVAEYNAPGSSDTKKNLR